MQCLDNTPSLLTELYDVINHSTQLCRLSYLVVAITCTNLCEFPLSRASRFTEIQVFTESYTYHVIGVYLRRITKCPPNIHSAKKWVFFLDPNFCKRKSSSICSSKKANASWFNHIFGGVQFCTILGINTFTHRKSF